MYLVSGYYSLASGYYITRNAENISPLSFIFQVEKAKLLTKNREASAFGVCSSQNAPGMISFHREVQVVSQITPALRSPDADDCYRNFTNKPFEWNDCGSKVSTISMTN